MATTGTWMEELPAEPPQTRRALPAAEGKRGSWHRFSCLAAITSWLPGFGSVPWFTPRPSPALAPRQTPTSTSRLRHRCSLPRLPPLLSSRGNGAELQGHSKTPSVQAPLLALGEQEKLLQAAKGHCPPARTPGCTPLSPGHTGISWHSLGLGCSICSGGHRGAEVTCTRALKSHPSLCSFSCVSKCHNMGLSLLG